MSGEEYSSRRSRRNYNADDDEEEDRSRSRRSRRAARDDDDEEEETPTRSSRRSRRTQDDDEEEEVTTSRRSRRQVQEEEEEEEAPSRARAGITISSSSSSSSVKKATMGATMQAMNEARRKRVQQAIIDGMAKYAESKFGRKRQAPKAGKGRTAMDDYEIYLRSLKAKIKTSQDKVNVVLKQKKEIDEKLKKAEADKAKNENTLREAEEEREIAESEGRDPKLPSGFVVPQTAKKAAAGSGFANLVMKASAQLWEDKFMAMRAKKGGSDGQPEWMNKTKSRDKVLVNVGKKKTAKEEENKPAWGANLKKSEPRRKGVEPKQEDNAQPAFAKVGLRKTQRKDDDDDDAHSKKVDWKEKMVKKPGGTTSSSSSSSRRRRGGDDSD